MPAHVRVAVAMFLTLVPVTLLVPGLHELVVVAHHGSSGDAHAFMTVNMVAGMVSIPVAMRLVKRWPDVRLWVCGALLLDALAFVGMGLAPSLPVLYAFRILDGAVHLPAVTLLMVASNRLSGDRRGGSLGALASAIMIGVAIGSPLGGWLVERDPGSVYALGAGLLILAALASATVGRLPVAGARARAAEGRRYAWNRGSAQTWIPLAYGFMDRLSIGIFVSTFTLFLTQEHALSASEKGVLIALFMLPFALLCYPAGRLADRVGWFAPMLVGNALFGIVFATYGVTPKALLPVAMIASGMLSALMFAPNLLLISDLARRGRGEGLFAAFQVAGSLGFLAGPIVGGVLVAATGGSEEGPAYATIFVVVGAMELLLAVVTYFSLRRLARDVAAERLTELQAPARLVPPESIAS